MREIKFRAWEPTIKKMFLTATAGDPVNPSVRTEDGWKECTEHAVIMQYTGRKDKSGKEIYEGDIVTDNSGKIYIEEWRSQKIIKLPTSVTTDFLWEKIIGNIYENPELLKKL